MEKTLDQTTSEFSGVRLSLASPEHILDWSHGEVTKPGYQDGEGWERDLIVHTYQQ